MFIKPFTEDELGGFVFVEGEATGEIEKVELGKADKSPDAYITVFCKVWDLNDNEIHIRDYISLGEKSRWKLGQLFKAVGKKDKLKEGFHAEDLPSLLRGAHFKCEITLQPSKNDPSKKYMNIKRYFEFLGVNAGEAFFGEQPPPLTEKDLPFS